MIWQWEQPAAPNMREILRYAGCKNPDTAVLSLVEECLAETDGIWQYRVCYDFFSVTVGENVVDFGFASASSKDLCRCLADCQEAVVFAATVGLPLDRLLKKYSRFSPAKAVILQAIGAERIEALCDAFCATLQMNGRQTKPRFSPGYGDLPLQLQQDFFRVLRCAETIGVTLNDSLLMTPSKSVTAVVGLKGG